MALSGWSATKGGPADVRLRQAVELLRANGTVHVGHLLAPFAMRYVVVPTRTGAGSTDRQVPPPADLATGLDAQLDLRIVERSASLTVYENMAWTPIRSALSGPGTLAAHSGSPAAAESVDLSTSTPALTTRRGRAWTGPVRAGEVLVAEASSTAWRLTVDGRAVPRRQAFGWATTFAIDRDGTATLRYVPPTSVPSLQAVLVIVWLGLLAIAVRFRTHRGPYA